MRYLVSIMLCLTLCLCGNSDPEQMLVQAEADLGRGDVEMAQSRCAVLSDTVNVTLAPEQMCRLAVIYGKLYDITREQDYATSGAQLMHRATAADAEGIEAYINTLAVEDMGVAQMLLALNNAINTPMGYAVDGNDEPTDTDCYGEEQ